MRKVNAKLDQLVNFESETLNRAQTLEKNVKKKKNTQMSF